MRPRRIALTGPILLGRLGRLARLRRRVTLLGRRVTLLARLRLRSRVTGLPRAIHALAVRRGACERRRLPG